MSASNAAVLSPEPSAPIPDVYEVPLHDAARSPGDDAHDGMLTEIGCRFSVLVVDDHDLVLCGLRLMLSGQPWVERCLPARDAVGAVALAERYGPRVALVDLRLDDDGGREICQALRAAAPECRVLLLTSAERLTRSTVMSIGAAGYVCKNGSAREIVRSVRMAGLGLRVTAAAAAPSLLSARQHEVLELLAAGGTNSEIAQRLFVSAHTVKQHTSAVYRKLNVRNRAEAIRRAQSLGLLG